MAWSPENVKRDKVINKLEAFADDSQSLMDWETYCYLKMLINRERLANLIYNNYREKVRKKDS